MKTIVKMVSVNDGKEMCLKNSDFLYVETYPRADKIVAAFLNSGYTLHSRESRIVPAEQRDGGYAFYMGGWNFVFTKEVDDGEEDDSDEVLKKVLEEISSGSDEEPEFFPDDDSDVFEDEFIEDDFESDEMLFQDDD